LSRCTAIKPNGERCKGRAIQGSEWCWNHNPAHAGEHLGYPYTTGELLEFAVRRVFEHEREIAPEILSAEATEQMAARWTEALRKQSFFGSVWDRIEADAPPESTRPWRGGY
jgi:hypothetical protein